MIAEGEVMVHLKGYSYAGRAAILKICQWPEKREALFICIPGHFPFTQKQLEEYGATIVQA